MSSYLFILQKISSCNYIYVLITFFFWSSFGEMAIKTHRQNPAFNMLHQISITIRLLYSLNSIFWPFFLSFISGSMQFNGLLIKYARCENRSCWEWNLFYFTHNFSLFSYWSKETNYLFFIFFISPYISFAFLYTVNAGKEGNIREMHSKSKRLFKKLRFCAWKIF